MVSSNITVHPIVRSRQNWFILKRIFLQIRTIYEALTKFVDYLFFKYKFFLTIYLTPKQCT